MVREELVGGAGASWLTCAGLALQGRNKAAGGVHRCLSRGSLDLQACLHFYLFSEGMHCWKSVHQSKTTLSSISRVIPAVLQLCALRGAGETGLAPVGWGERTEVLHHYSEMFFKMLKMSFIMEMEKYWYDTLGIDACASICLAEHWGKFSLPSC